MPSGVVEYTEPKMTGDGTLDESAWAGLDATSQGAVAEALPQPPQNDAEYQAQIEDAGSNGPGAPVLSGLAAGDLTDTTATVTWTTDKAASTKLEWGGSADALTESTYEDSTAVTEHSVALTGLTPETTYYLRAFSRDPDGNFGTAEASFTTPATPAAP